MKDTGVQVEKLRADAAECATISDLATDPQKRELFTRLATHLAALASEVEAAVAAKLIGGSTLPSPQLNVPSSREPRND
jgi:hypothetical protein